MSEHTKEPWHSEQRNWRGEQSEHKIYISGDTYASHEDDDDDSVTLVSTAVCIVEGNDSSHETTEANARRIVASVNFCEGLSTERMEEITAKGFRATDKWVTS